jgi:hypothetical protein
MNEATVVGRDKEGRLMAARGHSLGEPQQGIHIALAAERDEKNTERHVSGLASRE